MIAILLAVYTLQDIRNAQCQVGCAKIGYDDGFFEKNVCYCVDHVDFERAVGKKLIVPSKALPKSESRESPWSY